MKKTPPCQQLLIAAMQEPSLAPSTVDSVDSSLHHHLSFFCSLFVSHSWNISSVLCPNAWKQPLALYELSKYFWMEEWSHCMYLSIIGTTDYRSDSLRNSLWHGDEHAGSSLVGAVRIDACERRKWSRAGQKEELAMTKELGQSSQSAVQRRGLKVISW